MLEMKGFSGCSCRPTMLVHRSWVTIHLSHSLNRKMDSSDVQKDRSVSKQTSSVLMESPAKSSRHVLSASQLEKVCYRLGTSVKAGIPVAEAWANETELLRGRRRRAFERVQTQLKNGGSPADALSAEPLFPPLLTEMVRIGEESGNLDQAFLRMADHYRAIVRMKRTFLQGVTWPVMQLTAAAAAVSVFFVVLHVLETRIAGLVAPDVFMLGLSPLENLMLFWAVVLGAGVGLFLIVKGLKSGWFGSLPVRVAMMMPLLGSTIKELALSRFAWAFGTAVDSGMNATKAIQLGLSSTQNAYYQSRESEIAKSLAAGEDFFSALHRTDAFPPDLLQTIRTGELTGELTEGLERLSDDYQEQSALNLRRIGQISGFGIFLTVGSLMGFSILFMYAGYLGTLSDALSGQSLTLAQIREDQMQLTSGQFQDERQPTSDQIAEKQQPNSNPILATRDAMVKEFVENNKDFQQIESVYGLLGRYNEMTPDEFLDSIVPEPATPQRPSPPAASQDDASAETTKLDGRP